MKFVTELISEINSKKGLFEEIFGLSKMLTPSEEILRDSIASYWNPLPPSSDMFGNEYAVDSSSASRTVSNGVDFFIVRSLMIGAGSELFKKMQFEMLKGLRDPSIIHNFERILRDILEIEIIVLNSDKLLKGDLVLIDGNLYGRYTHLLKQLPLRNWAHLPLKLFDQMQKLFRICEEKEITVAGVSKFSKTRVLSNAILSENGGPTADPDILDVDVLHRWKNDETGYTTPLLLGGYAARGDELESMLETPESYLNRFFPSIHGDLREWGTEVIRKVPESPAIAMLHLSPARFHQPLRVDIPANCLGISKRLIDISPFEFISPVPVKPVVQQLSHDWGGYDVYNALLYIVDREVRLTDETVDRVYRNIISRELNVPIDYDRSTRRFTRR